MSIQHVLKSTDRQAASAVRSAEMTVVNGTIHMTVIPQATLAARGGVVEQANEVFQLIEDRLARLGSDKTRIAHVTVWIAHLLDFDAFTEAWNAWVDPAHPPARACAQVNMAHRDIRVEMIVVAST